ncbi:two-component system, sensor histidine kinase FlrB [Novimethylophilus kurashikiensis]|uniref:histidine kinase n=1 Tax=Novimethylophilus kurashikiensis TaxID=1825523 RepID=A0A2R5F2Q3_9PROT|nr:ATP-binding protein [Novimethylophilus kurashikiensis]GBG12866.1 two-component system, sensor histidine kinase FlrB [Novimethylophilus kurashikiensis]
MTDTSKPPSTQEELQQAFALFNQVSEQLTSAYAELQVKAEGLTQELAVANGELRRQYEEKEALSQRLTRLLDALPGGVVVLDAAGLVEEANPAALKLLTEPVIGAPWESVRERCLEATPTPGEWLLAGTERRISISSNIREGLHGEILLLQEVTDAYAMQIQLQRHKRLSAMGEMAAALAHQLRTPLAAALLYTSHLADANLAPEDRSRFSEKALGRLRYLEKLIKDMLVFVRGGRSAQEKILVSSLVSEVQQVMEPQLIQAGIAFTVDDQSQDACVLGSREALAGALHNLLSNAMQACKAGGSVSLSSGVDDGKILFKVCDTGKGIPVALQERLFEPFFTTRTEGTGLGLAIVREVVQIHGGEIAVKSVENEGSEFCLSFPIVKQ